MNAGAEGPATFDSWLALAGQPRKVGLAVPPAHQLLGGLLSTGHRPADLVAISRAATLASLVDSVDGAPFDFAAARTLMGDIASYRTLLDAAVARLGELRALGRVRAHCPHCADGWRELDLMGYVVAYAETPPAFFAPDGFLEPLWISKQLLPLPATISPDAAKAFTLVPPTVRLRIDTAARSLGERPLRLFTPEVKEHAFADWAYSGLVAPPAGRKHWFAGHPGFDGLVLLALALGVEPKSSRVDLEAIDDAAIVDILFADAAAWAVFGGGSNRPRFRLECRCGGTFEPFARPRAGNPC